MWTPADGECARRGPTCAGWPTIWATPSAEAPTCVTCAGPHRVVHGRRCPSARRDLWSSRPPRSCAATGADRGRRRTGWRGGGHGKVLEAELALGVDGPGPWAVFGARRRPPRGVRGPRGTTVKPAVVVAPAGRGLASEPMKVSTTPCGAGAPRARWSRSVPTTVCTWAPCGDRAGAERRRAGPGDRPGHLRSPSRQRGAPRVRAQVALRPRPATWSCWPRPGSTRPW